MALGVARGWYWYDFTAADRPAVDAFFEQNAASAAVRKTFRGQGGASEIIVFEVTGPSLVWPLKGWPVAAPKKLDTSPRDIAKAAANPSPSLQATLEELVGKPWAAIKQTADNANTALNILIFGGVAVLLWNLYQSTRASDSGED
jgi:hypothetical protein